MVMKTLLLASVALIVVASAASAADLPFKAMPVKAPPPLAYDWTGFYVGGYYADAIGNQKGATPTDTANSHSGETNVNQRGSALGLTAGYNWQLDPHWLVGVEGDLGWLGLDRTNNEFNDNTLVGLKTDWYATLRARGGYVTGPSLLYLTAGGAFVHGRDEFGGDFTTVGSTLSSFTTASWTAGGGIETKVSRNWSAKTEYLFIDGGSAHTFISNPHGFAGVPASFDQNFHVIKTGLNYRFGGANDEGFFAFITAPPMPSNHNWNGLYVGFNVGGGISNVNAVQTGTFPGQTQINGTGFAGGGQVGYNFMNILGPKWFAGLEADIGTLRIHAMFNDWFDEDVQFTANTSWYGTARARVGTTTGPALLYFTGGAAWVHSTDGFTPIPTALTATISPRTGLGYAIGGGTEVALNERWSAKVESLYMDTGHSIHQTNPPSARGADSKDRFTVVRAGLNLKLGD
jgi:outer membrane immunogenic protein